uniref:Uncharacterized protein n=1 Tax=Schmidtea mediterranea TaxID=79327 RepID=I1ZIA0_SCHMD|nr:hypothetical protein [Schmidtea mediterranea]
MTIKTAPFISHWRISDSKYHTLYACQHVSMCTRNSMRAHTITLPEIAVVLVNFQKQLLRNIVKNFSTIIDFISLQLYTNFSPAKYHNQNALAIQNGYVFHIDLLRFNEQCNLDERCGKQFLEIH